MKNARHIGCIGALAVALGVGLGVANAPAVASAAPGDSDKGSSDESSSRSSGNSRSSDTPSAKGASTDDTPSRDRRTGKTEVSSSGGRQTGTTAGSSESAATTDTTTSTSTGAATTPAKPDVPGIRAQGNTSAETNPNPRAVTPAAELPSFATAPPASVVVTQAPADPPWRGVSTLVNVDPPPVDNDAPPAPVRELAALSLLTGAGREFEQSDTASTTVNPPTGQVTTEAASPAADPGFISSTRSFFGLFSITSAGDPDDNNFVAVVFQTPFFTNVLTSGTDPEDNLGFGAASIGVAGQTVNTFISPFVTFSIGIPIEDPFAELFIELIRLGLV
jgi:hypothetical protein